MVFSNKSFKAILVLAISALPYLGFSNVEDSTATHNEHKTETVDSHVETKHDAHKVQAHGPVNTPDAVNEYINHHLQDSYDFHFFADGESGKHYGFSLPVILIDNGLKVFSSSKFHNEKEVAEVDGVFYKLHHGKIYVSDKEGNLSYDNDNHVTNVKPIDASVTKNVFSLLLTSVLLFFMFYGLAKSYQKNNGMPKGFGRVLEPLVLYVRDEIAIPNIGEKKYRKFMGYLLTVFFLVWLLNLLGMTPLGINITGNIAFTLCLALFTYIITQFSANKDYWGHIFWMPGVPVPMKIILAPIEVLGTLTKPFALMIRMFANITAGHVVVMTLISLIFVGKNLAADLPISMALTLFISVIEILVAFLQAYIFTMLSSLFIGMAVEEHHHDEDHH